MVVMLISLKCFVSGGRLSRLFFSRCVLMLVLCNCVCVCFRCSGECLMFYNCCRLG